MIEIQCSGGAWGWHHDDPVSLWMRIYVENQLVAEQYHHGTWYTTGGVYVAVRASTTDRHVMCTADVSMSSGVASGTILGSGPGSVTVKMAAFIPYPWVPHREEVARRRLDETRRTDEPATPVTDDDE